MTPAQKPPIPEDKARALTEILDKLENLKYLHVAEGMNSFYHEFAPLLKGEYSPQEVRQIWDRYVRWKKGYDTRGL